MAEGSTNGAKVAITKASLFEVCEKEKENGWMLMAQSTKVNVYIF